jgi:hypothetical protein
MPTIDIKNRQMEICELKPHGPNHKRLDKSTQRRRTYKTNHKLEKVPAYKLPKMLAKNYTHAHRPSLCFQSGKHSPTDEKLDI